MSWVCGAAWQRQKAEGRGQKAEGSKNRELGIHPCAYKAGKGLFALTSSMPERTLLLACHCILN